MTSKDFGGLSAAQAGCRVCGVAFARLALYDAHRANYRINNKQELVGECLSPADLDLRFCNSGVWYDEAGLRMLAKAAAARSTKASFKLEQGC